MKRLIIAALGLLMASTSLFGRASCDLWFSDRNNNGIGSVEG